MRTVRLDFQKSNCHKHNLNEFDLSSCYGILQCLTREISKNRCWDEHFSSMDPNDHSLAAHFNRLRLIRNTNFGSNKTTLGSKYGHNEKVENNKIVRWFNAESRDLVWNDYKNMVTKELRNDINERQIIINLVNSRLEILFIFDNAKCADDNNELIINLPTNVQTVITTKNNNFEDEFEFGNESNLEMKPFNKSECIEYMKRLDKKRTFNQFQAENLLI
ncbi:unnamed protein product [Didymodactylos carnosus]|uniref:Uncharacterized protein n=1 Tax=Didymodactylos carnosus TaxID=1234261 RepID=A0A815PJC6_9BILA|nr:unnamed protein product [Didymodactylos carnosus]CAF4323352.1 unnamed protein product [Didymodactylos carnosus]